MDSDPEQQTPNVNLLISPIATGEQTNSEMSIYSRVVEWKTLRFHFEIEKDAVDVQSEDNNLYLCPPCEIKPG